MLITSTQVQIHAMLKEIKYVSGCFLMFPNMSGIILSILLTVLRDHLQPLAKCLTQCSINISYYYKKIILLCQPCE